MKHLAFTLLFLAAQDVNAQCSSYLTLETLIKIKQGFDGAEDLLIDCFIKVEDVTIKYDDGTEGRCVRFSSKKKVEFGGCIASMENFSFYYDSQSIHYTVTSSSQFLAIKNAVKKNGKKMRAAVKGRDTYSYRGLEWNFGVDIVEKCKANDYEIAIYNLN